MGKKRKNKGNGPGGAKKIAISTPVPDERPNWADWDRHEVMMSVTMEYMPATLEEDYVAVICPVAKRRITVSYMGWTCSYNKLMAMDRKFQSALPGGNVRSVQIIKSNDMCILDCLHLKAERTFYILDLMHWKQLPYYQSEAEFRFHWINMVESEMDLQTCHPENEYKFKSMPRVPATKDALYKALEDAPWKVDGILFFYKGGFYTPGSTANVLWLAPEDIEKVLGWTPPDKVMAGRKANKAKEDAPKAKSEEKSSTSEEGKGAASTAASNSGDTATAKPSNTGEPAAAAASS